MPKISVPGITLPGISFHDTKRRDVKLPDLDVRNHLPDVDLTKLSMPDVRDLHLSDVAREIRAAGADLADVDLGRLDPRRMDLSGLDAGRLRQLAPFLRPAPRPASPLPWLVAGLFGGLVAGWWLATSSATGPRVRELLERVRTRVADLRLSGGSSRDPGTAFTVHGDDAHRAGPGEGAWDVTAGRTPAWDDALAGTGTGNGTGSASSDAPGGAGHEPSTAVGAAAG